MKEQESGLTFTPTGDAIVTRSIPDPTAGDAPSGFGPVVDRLRSADITTTNLEVVIADGEQAATPPRVVPDQYQYLASFPGMVIHAPPGILDDLSAIGIDMVSAASNHSLDFGRVGMERTMAALEARDIPYAGLGPSLESARAPAYTGSPDGRVGLVGATTSVPPGGEAGPTGSWFPGATGVSPLAVRWRYGVTPEHLAALREVAAATGIDAATDTWRSREVPDTGDPGIGAADAAGDSGPADTDRDELQFMHMSFETVGADEDPGIRYGLHAPDRTAILEQVAESASVAGTTIMSLHSHQAPGGVRNRPETPDFLIEFAHDCIDAGADAFVGTGPHVLRGIEIYRDRPIFYSLGNFFCQFETMGQLPPQSFEYYGLADDRRPSSVFDARYYDADGTPTGNLAYPEYWRTVVPTCQFDPDGTLDRIELLPCSLGRTRDRPVRGTPRTAEGETATAILDEFEALSDPFGTVIQREGDRGYVVAGG